MNQPEYQYHRLWLEVADQADEMAKRMGMEPVNEAAIERVSNEIATYHVDENEARGRVFVRLGL